MAPAPMRTPGRIVAFAPTEAPLSTTVSGNDGRWRLERGKMSLVKVAFGPTNTELPSLMPSQSCTPDLMVTKSPMTTSFSMNTPSQILQSRPIRAPGSTCVKAQIRVPAPTFWDSQIPCEWTNTSLTIWLSRRPRPLFEGSPSDARERSITAFPWYSRKPARHSSRQFPAPAPAASRRTLPPA